MFIKLTQAKSEPGTSDYWYINPMYIQAIGRYFDKYTSVKCVAQDGWTYKVEETPEEIFKLIEESGFKDIMNQLGLGGIA